MKIDAVREDDLPRLVEVWEASVRATHHFLTDADIAFFKPLVATGLYGVIDLACIRDDDGKLIAFLGTAEKKVEALFVDPSRRGTGLGRALLEHAVRNLGAETVDVNEQNEQAAGFYRHFGFVVEGRSETDSLGKPFPLLHMRVRRDRDR